MTAPKYPNKVQEYAARVGIKNQFALRRALMAHGIAEATARQLWLGGATSLKSYQVIQALAIVLQVEPEELLEDEK